MNISFGSETLSTTQHNAAGTILFLCSSIKHNRAWGGWWRRGEERGEGGVEGVEVKEGGMERWEEVEGNTGEFGERGHDRLRGQEDGQERRTVKES